MIPNRETVSLFHITSVIGVVIAVLSVTLWLSANQSQSANTNPAVTSAGAARLAVASPHQSASSSLQPTGGGGIQLSGNAVVVPSHSPTSDTLPESELADNDKQASIYTVRKGDTLGNIAELFDVSVNTIVWANDIKGETITTGDTLIILPVSGVRHEVEQGETVSGLAERYDVSAEKIRSYNELEDNQLAVGGILDIPGGEMPANAAESNTESQQAQSVQVANNSVTPTQSAQSGYYTHPLPGSVRTQGRHGYNAVDFGAPIGTSVVASASGRVTKSVPYGWNGGYGKFLVIEHPNGTETLYSHFSDVVVRRGQRVVQGQVVGYVGDTGRSTGPHLHFEVRGARNPF